ncbi:MAG: branched-chain amino acid ABC transporter permease, partial [Cyclobacteriaceae bacterium]|nr:branched-chain amino acid ABC transporter permease [Cyclobacteriaceae bacterium]
MKSVILVQQLFYGLTTGMGYAMFSLGLTLILGVRGTLNIAHGTFFMLGALTISSLSTYLGLNYILAAVLSVVLVGIAGMIVCRLVVEPLIDHPNPLLTGMLATLAVSIVITHSAMAIWGTNIVPLTFPLEGGVLIDDSRYLSWARIILFIVGIITFIFFYVFLTKSRMGKNIRAISQSRIGASLVGINFRRSYALTFGISSALAALAGVLLAFSWLASSLIGQSMLLKGFIIVIVGGLGSVKGAIIIGLLLGLIEIIFGYYG